MTDREIMEQALDALEEINKLSIGENAICLPAEIDTAMDALRSRLAQPEQEPVAWVTGWHGGHCVIRAVDPAAILQIGTALYTTPPQRKPLTDEEIDALVIDKDGLPNSHLEFARAIEAAHGITGET